MKFISLIIIEKLLLRFSDLYIFFNLFSGDAIHKLERKLEIPVFHCHGEADDIIPIAIGRKTSDALTNLIQQYEFHSFPYMKHDANDSTMDLVQKFITKHLPPM